MMYTVTPVNESEFAGYFIAFVLAWFLWGLLTFFHWAMEGEVIIKSRWNVLYWGVFLFFSMITYVNSPTFVPPKNEKVEVYQVGEGGQMESTGGKHPRNYYQMYVFYQTPNDGVVAIRRAEGKVYPDRAILYKN